MKPHPSFASLLIGLAVAATAVCHVGDARAAPRAKPVPVAAPAPTPPAMRLGNAVKPLAYEAELTIVPTQDRFAGRIVIHAELAQPVDFFWMNATRLEVRSANVVAGGRTFVGKAVAGGREFVGLRFASALPAGRIVITIEYDGAIDRTETAGIFRQQDGGRWYAFTQFEPTEARRAFPCFDEPGWKVPWHLSLVVPQEDVAASNMPIASEEAYVPPAPAVAPMKGAARKGASPTPAPSPAPIPMKRVRFAPTPPLPSYLVAFAVGPFDVVDGGRAGRKGTPMRYLVPKGRANETAYAKDAMPKLLEILEDSFGMPYPYEKLDSVAVPVTVGFGAMENVGLITYELPLLLARPEQESERFKRWLAATAAHEMAHQWFGDYVTMQWWNDVWLNESFATWLGHKAVDRYAPTWQEKLASRRLRYEAIEVDRLSSTRQMRQAVRTMDDLGNAFDPISYQKGAAVLAMFENQLGEERFRNAVRRYVNEHAQGNARAEDFFNAIVQEGGPDGATVVAGLRSFVEQPGVPRLSVMLDCGAEGKGAPKLAVAQSRFLPASTAATPQVAQQRWTVPACFQFGSGGDFAETCAVVQESRSSIALPAQERCPQWVLPNRRGNGYFVSSLSPDLTQQLAHAPLLPAEAVPVLYDATILMEAGDWPADVGLDLASRFAGHRQPVVAEVAAQLAKTVRPSWLDDPTSREGYARFVQKNFGARARMLGWMPKQGERDGEGMLRDALVAWVADMGNDAALQKDALRIAREAAGGKGSLPIGAGEAMQAAARMAQGAAGRDLLDGYLDAAKRMSGRDRDDVLRALGSFRDPPLAEAAYDALLEGDGRDVLGAMLKGAWSDEGSTVAAIGYLKTHFDAIAKKLPDDAMAFLVHLGDNVCDAGPRNDLEAAFGDRAGRLKGASRSLGQAVERTNICIAARQSQKAVLKAWLAKQ